MQQRRIKKMIGCSHYGGSGCGASACPIAPLPMRGGNLPPPFYGKPWGPTPQEWPGFNDSRNYFSLNKYPIDFNGMAKLRGGARRKRHKTNKRHRKRSQKRSRKYRGGSIMPQELVNLGRNFSFNAHSAYNTLRGIPAPANPLPYKGQLIGRTV